VILQCMRYAIHVKPRVSRHDQANISFHILRQGLREIPHADMVLLKGPDYRDQLERLGVL